MPENDKTLNIDKNLPMREPILLVLINALFRNEFVFSYFKASPTSVSRPQSLKCFD